MVETAAVVITKGLRKRRFWLMPAFLAECVPNLMPVNSDHGVENPPGSSKAAPGCYMQHTVASPDGVTVPVNVGVDSLQVPDGDGL
jgi:hypothetical protein